MIPSFFYTILSLPVCTYGLMRNSLWSVDRGTENSGLVFAWYAGTTGKSTAVALQLLSETSLKDNCERKSCKKTELKALHLLIVCLGIKMTRYAVICILIHGLWPMVWLDGQGFVIKMIQKLMARGCEKQIYIRTLLGKHVKFFVSHVVCHAKSLQSCLTLCNLMYYSLPDSSVHEILLARILECVAKPSSRGSSRPKDWTCISYISCIDRWVLYL